MATRSLKSIKPKVWIPPIYSANYKVTVERSDGTIDDITDILFNLKIDDMTTSGIGSFEFEIPNGDEKYTSVWNGMEIFRYYCDYAGGTATTLRFRGRIERPSRRRSRLFVRGRSEALFVQGQGISKNYVNKDIGFIIKDLFNSYGQSRYDTGGINVSTGIIVTMTFRGMAFWDAIETVCASSGYDCYVAAGLTIEFFENGLRTNTDEGIVHDYNLIEVGDFTPDLSLIKNQIRVIGGTVDGVRVRYTANDTSSQDTYGIRREEIIDDGILTLAAAKELAEAILLERKNPPIIGKVKGLLLATIQPGEKIRLSSPMEGLSPSTYSIISYSHEIGQEGLYTTVSINKESRKISHVLKDRIQRENREFDASSNVDDLDYADIELFNTFSGTFSDTGISNGVLKLNAGKDTGYWVSPQYGPGDGRTIDQVKIDLVGENIPGVIIKVSTDGGAIYNSVNKNEAITFGVGNSIMVKLELNSGTQINSLVAQYSMTT